jgi:hypothetical protein
MGYGDATDGKDHTMRDLANGKLSVQETAIPPDARDLQPLHPAWRAFIRFCREMGHGDIELLRVQDGLPVLAEITRKKIRF